MKKKKIQKKFQISNRVLIVTVTVLSVIIVALAVLLVLESNGVFYSESETGDKITPPQRVDSQTQIEGDYYYTLLTDGTVMITAYIGKNEENIVIPSTLGAYRVSAVGEAAYAGLTVSNAKTVTVSEGITYLGKNVFLGAQNAILYLPSTIKQIDDNATYGFEDPVAIYFAGTQAEWNEVKVGSGNKELVIVQCNG
jgi:hypothetical protein